LSLPSVRRSSRARLQLRHVGLDPAERLHQFLVLGPRSCFTKRDATAAVRSDRKPIPTNIKTIPINRPCTVVGFALTLRGHRALARRYPRY
jgi:hypothetical protein